MTRILVVEDDRHLQRVISLWLERNGYEVRCCGDGRTALQAFREAPAEILLADVNLPGMDGVTLVKAVLAEAERPMGIIILSCRVDMMGIGEELGGERVIHHPKPFSPSRLIQEVETLRKKISELESSRAQASGEGGQVWR